MSVRSVGRPSARLAARPVPRSKDGQIHTGWNMLDPPSAKELRAASVLGNPAARGYNGQVDDILVSLLSGAKAIARKILFAQHFRELGSSRIRVSKRRQVPG